MFNIQAIRESKNIGVNELSRLSHVNASYISALERGEKQNPTLATLKKIADALNVTIDDLMKSGPISQENLKEWDKNTTQLKEETSFYESGEFKTPEAAIKFVLKQPAIMGFGGFDINKMSDKDIISFANELLNQLKLLGYKYSK